MNGDVETKLDQIDIAILDALKAQPAGMSFNNLSTHLQRVVSRVTLAKRLKRLEGRDLISIKSDPHHRQRKIFRLPDATQHFVAMAHRLEIWLNSETGKLDAVLKLKSDVASKEIQQSLFRIGGVAFMFLLEELPKYQEPSAKSLLVDVLINGMKKLLYIIGQADQETLELSVNPILHAYGFEDSEKLNAEITRLFAWP